LYLYQKISPRSPNTSRFSGDIIAPSPRQRPNVGRQAFGIGLLGALGDLLTLGLQLALPFLENLEGPPRCPGGTDQGEKTLQKMGIEAFSPRNLGKKSIFFSS
jgi:hypothetical protein